MKLNFRTSDFHRRVADTAGLILRNRYFEKSPYLANEDEQISLLARPGMRKLTEVGTGPIRGMQSSPGSFNGDMFIASGEDLYRMDSLLNKTLVFSGLSANVRSFVNMAITARISEAVPEYLFVADGSNLYIYVENGYAKNTLTGSPAVNDTVRIGDTYYKFVTGSVDAGSPNGTSGNPYLVASSLSPATAFERLFYAINASGEPGVDYSTTVESNPSVIATNTTSSGITVRARIAGATGNGIITTETGSSIEWTEGGTLADGGDPYFQQVQLPGDVGAIDVAVINSYVIVIPTQGGEMIGRFYWIEPGETTVDPANYATAERSPDGIYGVQVFGDQFWLPGTSTTEVWYPTGDYEAPMRRLQGVVFDRGSWENTAKAINETMVVVDANGGVFLIRGGSPQRVSSPDIEEQIRRAMAKARSTII